jgi:hypothetical protein
MHAPLPATRRAILTTLAFLAFTPFTRAADLLLADHAQTTYTILTPAHPAPAESLAASELAHYLQALSGAQLKTLSQDDSPSPHTLSLMLE